MTGYLTLRYQGYPVSVAMVNDEPWFVGKDIACILGCHEPAGILEEIKVGKDRLKAIGYCEACVHNYRADLINRTGVLILFQRLGMYFPSPSFLISKRSGISGSPSTSSILRLSDIGFVRLNPYPNVRNLRSEAPSGRI